MPNVTLSVASSSNTLLLQGWIYPNPQGKADVGRYVEIAPGAPKNISLSPGLYKYVFIFQGWAQAKSFKVTKKGKRTKTLTYETATTGYRSFPFRVYP